MKEPNYIQKLYAMDKFAQSSPFAVGDEMRNLLTLQEESHPFTYSTAPECDEFRLGMSGAALEMVQVAANQFKKK